jgi:hypothetical protein
MPQPASNENANKKNESPTLNCPLMTKKWMRVVMMLLAMADLTVVQAAPEINNRSSAANITLRSIAAKPLMEYLYDKPHATEFTKLGRIPVLKARMNADLHMAEDLKNTGKGNLFVIFGEPDIEVACGWWLEVAEWWPIMSTLNSYRELEVWKKSIDLVERI